MESFSEQILRMCIAFNVKKSYELADKLDVSANTISTWRNRKKVPGKHLLAVAQLTGVSFEWLRSGTGPGPNAGTRHINEAVTPDTGYQARPDGHTIFEQIELLKEQAEEILLSKSPYSALLENSIKTFYQTLHNNTAAASSITEIPDKASVGQ